MPWPNGTAPLASSFAGMAAICSRLGFRSVEASETWSVLDNQLKGAVLDLLRKARRRNRRALAQTYLQPWDCKFASISEQLHGTIWIFQKHTRDHTAPTAKRRRAALRQLFDGLVAYPQTTVLMIVMIGDVPGQIALIIAVTKPKIPEYHGFDPPATPPPPTGLPAAGVAAGGAV